ncbi:hypothetical protein FQR65_LT06248 [Abscondita terminalis]|nr:hypothetical protein FQR65_LT06248 [Abscondita terminalis]
MTQYVKCTAAMNVGAKSPISILQERAMCSSTPMPEYNIIQDGTNFKCIVRIGAIKVESEGGNKKQAKHNAAEKALYVLMGKVGVNEPSKRVIESSPKIDNCYVQISNSVGQLNELCAKNGDIKPTYDEIFENGFLNSGFVMKCKLFDYETNGRGRTKKEAKQAAALKMLNNVKQDNFACFAQNSKTAENECCRKNDETIINIFKRLSIAKLQLNNNNVTDFVSSNVTKTKSDCEFWDTTENVVYLKEALAKLRISFKITEFQKDPLVLTLRTESTKPSYTFMHSALTYEETELILLKKTLNGLHILLEFV